MYTQLCFDTFYCCLSWLCFLWNSAGQTGSGDWKIIAALLRKKNFLGHTVSNFRILVCTLPSADTMELPSINVRHDYQLILRYFWAWDLSTRSIQNSRTWPPLLALLHRSPAYHKKDSKIKQNLWLWVVLWFWSWEQTMLIKNTVCNSATLWENKLQLRIPLWSHFDFSSSHHQKKCLRSAW